MVPKPKPVSFDVPADALTGLPVSAGIVEGRACFILDMAVVGEHATRLIRDGQRIRVHGTDGYIEILH